MCVYVSYILNITTHINMDYFFLLPTLAPSPGVQHHYHHIELCIGLGGTFFTPTLSDLDVGVFRSVTSKNAGVTSELAADRVAYLWVCPCLGCNLAVINSMLRIWVFGKFVDAIHLL